MSAARGNWGKYLAVAMIVGAALFPAMSAYSYLADRTAGATAGDHWPQSTAIHFRVNPSKNSNIQGATSVKTIIQNSFSPWTNSPNTNLTVIEDADTTSTATGVGNPNLVCFVCNANFSDAGTLAITLTTTATDTSGGHFVGQILSGDILFNPAKNFSTDGVAAGQDLQTVATHEVGHFFGLSHSAVVRAVMFPFAPDNLQTLSYDDVAAISSSYPSAAAVVSVGQISGTVRLNNSPVFGAHVFAESQTNADPFINFPNIRKTPIGNVTLPDGTYTIQGVPADSYVVTAEPLDDPVKNGDIADFAPAFSRTAVQTNFTTRSH